MATKRQVEGRLRKLIKRLEESERGTSSLAESIPEPRIIELVVPDVDAVYWTELAGGSMAALNKGSPQRSDVRIEVSSDDLVALVDGKASIFSSYLNGSIKVDASMSDLMRLRKLA